MKLKYTLFSIIFTVLFSAGSYAQSQPSAPPKISLKDAWEDIIDTIYDPEYASMLSFDDRLILGVSRVLIELSIRYQTAGRQIPKYQLRQIKNQKTDEVFSVLTQLPSNRYFIEKLGIFPAIASGILFLLGLLASAGLLGPNTHGSTFFKLFGIALVISAIELIAKFYRLYQRFFLVHTQLEQQSRNQAPRQRRMF